MSFGDDITPETGLPPYVLPMVNLAANGPPVSLPEIPPNFLSNGVRVLGLGPPVLFQCSINFTIYCAEKTKQNTTNWVTLKPNYDLSVTFNTHGNPSLGAFRKLIADHCNSEYNSISKIIQDGTTTEPPTITWDAYILKNKRFPKNSPLALLDDITFNQWIQEINSSKLTKGGVALQMENPRTAKTRAHKEDLLARTLKRKEACNHGSNRRSARAMGDSEEVSNSF
jgi:hypothetical protein